MELRSQEESFFRQKARIRWLKEGDRNTKFFHQYVSKRHLRNRILSVVDSSGNQITEPQLVQQHFVEHFHDFLKPRMELDTPQVSEIREVIRTQLNDDQISFLARPVSDLEI